MSNARPCSVSLFFFSSFSMSCDVRNDHFFYVIVDHFSIHKKKVVFKAHAVFLLTPFLHIFKKKTRSTSAVQLLLSRNGQTL